MHLRDLMLCRIAQVSMRERMLGSIWGMMVGDALGVPAEGSVNLRALDRDYGTIRDIMPVSQGPQVSNSIQKWSLSWPPKTHQHP
jgi:ADP-ribosylglycohydrolase